MKTTNPDNKYDDGTRERFYLWATEDAMVINLIGRGVLVGMQTVTEGTVQPGNEEWIGRRDYLWMLDGGGHAWMHEIPEWNGEKSDAHFQRWVGNRTVIKVQPNHQVTATVN
jgi:hypothetical protein